MPYATRVSGRFLGLNSRKTVLSTPKPSFEHRNFSDISIGTENQTSGSQNTSRSLGTWNWQGSTTHTNSQQPFPSSSNRYKPETSQQEEHRRRQLSRQRREQAQQTHSKHTQTQRRSERSGGFSQAEEVQTYPTVHSNPGQFNRSTIFYHLPSIFTF